MFGDRMVLMEGEDGASGGGGQGPAIVTDTPEPTNLIAQGGEAAAKLMFTGGASQQEMNPVEVDQTTDVEPSSAIVDSSQVVEREIGSAPAAVQKPAGKVDKPIRVVGQIDKVYTPGELAAKKIYAENERAYNYAVGASTLQAGYASEASLLQWNEINERDYEGRRELIDTEFPKWRRANEQLSKDIDDARAMKVNPYNYMNSIGRAGRVASILSVGISQLAAGAGNPSTVGMRLDAAVNRDIAAQKTNIDLTWKGIGAQRQHTQDEIALLEQQFNFEDRARAVAYAAISAKLGAAKQHATNEVTYYNTEMVETRAQALSVEAAAQARAKMATFMLDAKVASVHAAGRRAQQMRAVAQMRHAQIAQQEGLGAGTLQAAQAMDRPDLQAEPGMGAQAAPTQAQVAPIEAPQAAPTGQPAPAMQTSPAANVSQRRDQVRQQAPSAAATGSAAPTATPAPPESIAAPTEAAAPPTSIEKPTGEVAVREEQKHESLLNVQGPAVRKHGSNAGAAQAARGEPVTARDLDDMAADLRNRPTNIAIASNINDAKALRHSYPRPNPENPVFKGKQGAVNLASAQKHWDNVQRFPELLVKDSDNIGPNGEYVAGRSNYLDPSLLGGTLRIREGREHLLNDPAKRSAAEVVINQTVAETNRLVDAAENFARQGGTGAIFGIRFTEDGASIDKFDETAQATQWENQRLFLGASIKAIKDRDPSGRLSNEDVGFGEQLASMMNAGGATLDQLQRAYKSAFGKPGDLGSIQAAAGRVFAAIATDQMLHLDTLLSNDVVLSAEAQQYLTKKAARVGSFIAKENESATKRADEKAAAAEAHTEEFGNVGELEHLGDRAWEAFGNPLKSATFLPRELGAAVWDGVSSLFGDDE